MVFRNPELLIQCRCKTVTQNLIKLVNFKLKVREHFFMERVVRLWNRFPSLTVFKRHLDIALKTKI